MDCSLFLELRVGERLDKAAGERVLQAGDRRLPLAPSPEARGSLGVPVAAALAPALGFALAARRRRA